MYKLSLKDGGAFLGSIDSVDLQLLIDQLEEEHEKDNDYYVCSNTIEVLAVSGASEGLVKILKDAVGNSKGVEVAWTKT